MPVAKIRSFKTRELKLYEVETKLNLLLKVRRALAFLFLYKDINLFPHTNYINTRSKSENFPWKETIKQNQIWTIYICLSNFRANMTKCFTQPTTIRPWGLILFLDRTMTKGELISVEQNLSAKVWIYATCTIVVKYSFPQNYNNLYHGGNNVEN